MSWFENNPLGVALAGACALLLAAALLLTWAWSWPASSDSAEFGQADQDPLLIPQMVNELGPVKEYQEINNRPVFNESRRPVVEVEEGPEELVVEGPTAAATPEVRLTGVVITPDARIVTLTPNKDGKPVIIREGMPLEGEYVGWSVSSVDDRTVTLESNEGESFNLELVVHDTMIKEPPRPEPVIPPGGEAGSEPGEGGEPLSRAEEIRQRIQERREQLRREAEEEEGLAEEGKATQRNEYQDAIRSMMNRNRNNDNASKEDDGE